MKADIAKIIESIAEEFIGVWKFRTLGESEDNKKWCASVIVSGKLFDTEDYSTIGEAVLRAAEIVEILKRPSE